MRYIAEEWVFVGILPEKPLWLKEPTGAREGIPRAKRAALAGASGVCKGTQTAGEISLDITDFGEGLVWLFALDLKGR